MLMRTRAPQSPETLPERTPSTFAPAPFDGHRYRNASGRQQQGLAGVLKWMLARERTPWPDHVEATPPAVPPPRVDDGTLLATPVGHATVLLQFQGLNLLTDPVFAARIGPTPWTGPRRVRPPGVRLADLPPIDVVLLSHNHYDHLDRPTLAALARRAAPPRVLTGARGGRGVPRGLETLEMDWGDRAVLGHGVHATFVGAEHFSGRGPFDTNAALWGGFVLETALGPVYFAGDTGMGEHFEHLHARFGPMALSLLPIGAYRPRWFMEVVHIDPAQALQASMTLQSRVSLAIHHGVFRLADEGLDTPVVELRQAIADVGGSRPGTDFRTPSPGEAVRIAPR